jgi:hypothetical protein
LAGDAGTSLELVDDGSSQVGVARRLAPEGAGNEPDMDPEAALRDTRPPMSAPTSEPTSGADTAEPSAAESLAQAVSRSGEEAKGGTVGAKSALGLMTTEETIPARARAEQTLPGRVPSFLQPNAGQTGLEAGQADGLGNRDLGWSRPGPSVAADFTNGAESKVQVSAPGLSAPVLTVEPGGVAGEVRPLAALAVVDRIETQLERAVVDFRRVGSDSMTVVLRPDGGTEMELQLSLREGGVDIVVLVRRGDYSMLNAHWNQLQQSLSTQGVRLGALQDESSPLQAGPGWNGPGQRERQGSLAGEGPGRAERVAAEVPAARPGARVARGASGRLWESWA